MSLHDTEDIGIMCEIALEHEISEETDATTSARICHQPMVNRPWQSKNLFTIVVLKSVLAEVERTDM